YPRTDNTVYPHSINLKSVLKKLKGKTEYDRFIDEILSFDHIRPSRGKTETTDHPPVYTVDSPKEDLKGDYKKIYDLILRRFLSTLYREGEKTVQKAEIEVEGYIFNASGSKITDMGWLSIYGYNGKNEELPELSENEELAGKAWNMKEDQTKPPARYDMSSLLKKMEDLNLGTKSTRHEIIAKLADRGFIEGNPVKPTNLGMSFIDAVKSQKSKIAEPEMTAELENDMDRIEKNDMKEDDVVSESRQMLHSILLNFDSNKESLKDMIINGANRGEIIGKCPLDGKNLLLIKDRYTNTIKCENESCRINFKIKKYGMIQLTDKSCPICGLPMIKIIRRGQSPEIKCIDPDCSYNRDKDNIGECPADGGRLVIRQSKYGKRFLGCSNYPNCKTTYPLPQTGSITPAGEKCPYCGAPILIIRKKGRKWKFCPKIDCEYNKRKKDEGKS
ncbi:MAG: DNA topoisomerase, partial [Thermoplasmata archaeon]